MTFTIHFVTVCYQAEALIERTMRSVCEQTYPHIEYWIMDGASTDST
ncbi:MAG: glycosyltransferase, partial [Bacteroidales bacterium]|nr:glycosyltransferase [Bacteroidales bacterium]